MIIFPAIDIRDGKCVRLIEGDFGRETVFDQEPADAARRWESLGATHLHLVDLDGARTGKPVNLVAIERIRQAVGAKLQLGGGIRTEGDARTVMDLGIDRVILGSVIVQNPDATSSFADMFPEQLAAGLDARDGKLATDGWINQSDVLATDAAKQVVAAGVNTIIYTDIRRDGTLTGPNLDALREMIAVPGALVVASGGISSIEDVSDVAAAGATGVIIGRALYDGRVDLKDALRWL